MNSEQQMRRIIRARNLAIKLNKEALALRQRSLDWQARADFWEKELNKANTPLQRFDEARENLDRQTE
jgi:hypothetical protein